MPHLSIRRPRLRSVVLAALTLLATVASASAHPQDGPHADVRVGIDDGGVHFTITMNLVFMDDLVTVPRESVESLHPVEADDARDALVDFFRTHNRVTIDGVEVSPVATGFEILPVDRSLVGLFPVSGLRGLQRVRLELEHSAKAPPRRVEMIWGPFPRDLLLSTPEDPRSLEIVAELSAYGLNSIITFTEDEPEFTWHDPGTTVAERFLPVPEPVTVRTRDVPVVTLVLVVIAGLTGLVTLVGGRWRRRPLAIMVTLVLLLGLAGASWSLGRATIRDPFDDAPRLPDATEAIAIFTPLHANIYRAFDYTDESQVYDALARSVDGRLLDDLYNEIYRSLIMQEEGGAVSRVQSVTPLEQRVESVGIVPGFSAVGFHIMARWQVTGIVVHWGHSHRRTNEYAADYTVISTPAGWRIAGSQILEQFRVDAAPAPVVLPPGTEL